MQGIPQGQSPQGGSGGGSQKPSLSWQSPGAPKLPLQNPNDKSDKSKSPQFGHKTSGNIDQDKTNTATYILIFLAGLIVGVLLGWGIISARSGSSSTATSTDQSATTSGTSMTDTGGTLTAGTSMESTDVVVASPQKAGLAVAVSKAVVSKPTWVAVYDDNSGVPGRALGATLFSPASAGGETSGTIILLRAMVAGKNYLVGERVDNGDHVLSFADDPAVVDANGKPVLTVLTAQ